MAPSLSSSRPLEQQWSRPTLADIDLIHALLVGLALIVSAHGRCRLLIDIVLSKLG